MRGETGKTISHIVSEYSKLAHREYIERNDSFARMVHWKLCEKFNPKKSENKMEKTATIIDMVIPGEKAIIEK